jgi:Delta14-sterol reductase
MSIFASPFLHYYSPVMAPKTSKSKIPQDVLNPKTNEYEFLGPAGALLVSLVCPIMVFSLIFLCNEDGCPPSDPSTWKYQFPDSMYDFIDWKAIKWYFSFQFALALAWLALPGNWFRGRQLRDGAVLEYKCNGMPLVDMIM